MDGHSVPSFIHVAQNEDHSLILQQVISLTPSAPLKLGRRTPGLLFIIYLLGLGYHVHSQAR